MINITFERIIFIIVSLSVIALFVSIIVDFTLYNDKSGAKQSQKSIVATGSMIGFYFIYYLVIRFKIGELYFQNDIVTIFGTLFIVLGCVMNIIGRFNLGANWANQIKIYDNHTLINSGMYKIVRHPLYSSIMLMLIGGSVVYSNWISAILTIFIFIPFMHYRAKQEEKLLTKEFESYEAYRKNVGMFFPKIWR